MNRHIKSLILTIAAGISMMFGSCTDTTVDKVVSLNNQYADSFDQTTTQEEFLEQQTAYAQALTSLTQEVADKQHDLSYQELNAVERSFARADSSMHAAAARLGL